MLSSSPTTHLADLLSAAQNGYTALMEAVISTNDDTALVGYLVNLPGIKANLNLKSLPLDDAVGH